MEIGAKCDVGLFSLLGCPLTVFTLDDRCFEMSGVSVKEADLLFAQLTSVIC